jgi:hypothetical protein
LMKCYSNCFKGKYNKMMRQVFRIVSESWFE